MRFFSILSSFLLSFTLFGQAPKLMVGIVVDQMCYDYLHRFEKKFGKNGFNKLKNQGAFCSNTHYNYVPTYTAPGHASIYTGTTPADHGIVANDWINPKNGKDVYCVEDFEQKPVGTTNTIGLRSPKNLLVNTVTDQLKLAYPSSKVISLSIKDRSAILPGGHLSNGSFWYDAKTKNMISSTFYMNQLPDWVEQFNDKKIIDSYTNATWDTYLPIEKYTESDADNNSYEFIFKGKTTPTFPYVFSELTPHTALGDLFINTPFANTYLTDFAIAAIQAEKLGKNETPDFLCISYSTPDLIGHLFGPYSKEIEDTYIRLDLEIERLITQLEKQVGKGNFTLFLTADHAVVPIPQQLVDKQLPGGYFYSTPFKEFIESSVKEKFARADFKVKLTNHNIYLQDSLLELDSELKYKVVDFIKDQIKDYPSIKYVYTANELLQLQANNKWKKMVEKGYKVSRSGDLIYLLESGYLSVKNEKSEKKGTSHGSAYSYDTQVPLLFYGKNIQRTRLKREVLIVDIAPTVAQILNITQPSSTTGLPIIEVLNQK